MAAREEKIKSTILISGTIFLTIVLMIFFRYNSDNFQNVINKGQQNLIELYTKNLKPIFSRHDLTKKDIFNFAASGSLPLDYSENKYLNVDKNNGQAVYEIKNLDEKQINFYDQFVNSHNLDEEQIEKLDSLLTSYEEDIYTSVFENEDNIYAVNQDLLATRTLLQIDLQKLFNNIFTNTNGYSVKHHIADSLKQIIINLRENSKNNYFIIAPDTMLSVISNLNSKLFKFNSDSLTVDEFEDSLLAQLDIDSIYFSELSGEDSSFDFEFDSEYVKIVFNDPSYEGLDEFKNIFRINVSDSNKFVDISFTVDTVGGAFSFNVVERDDESTKNVSMEFNLNNLTKLIGSSIALMSEMDESNEEQYQTKIDSLMRVYNLIQIDSVKNIKSKVNKSLKQKRKLK